MHRVETVPLSQTAEGIPSAQGDVRAVTSKDLNKRVTVEVKHMAPPSRIQSGATVYVVWARPDGSDTVQNIGALRVDKNLTGSLTTMLPYQSFKLFITAEPSGSMTQPTGEELLAANVAGTD
ncbi:MAG: hypothetical protein IPJ65_37370 [Archangiaceae bacterium]|nr:hypothetical protein [Archangiaceae bacterium]